MDINMLLYVTFLIYIIVLVMSYMFNVKWLVMLAGLLWFVPITNIDNIFIVIISIIMIIVHFMIGLTPEGDGFE